MDRQRIEGLPVWMLTPKEEKEVFENWRVNTWKYCDEYVSAFHHCEQVAGFGVWIKCRKEGRAMRECIKARQDQKFVDEERDKFIQKKIEFQKAQQEKQEDEKRKLAEAEAAKNKSGWKFWARS